MTDLHHLKISAPAGHSINATVELDGKPVMVSRVEVYLDAEDVTCAVLSFPHIAVEVETPVVLTNQAVSLARADLRYVPCPAVYVGSDCVRCGDPFTADDHVDMTGTWAIHSSCSLQPRGLPS